MDPDAGVIFARTATGAAVALGLLKCGRIWLCPVCSAKIRHGRAEEITEAVVSWLRQGGTAYLVTFTARHTAADRLSDLMDAIQGTRANEEAGTKRRPGAYQRLITGAAWAGDKRRKSNQEGIRGRIGYIGMIRATEVTVGEGAGWHPHIHAIVLVGGRTEGQRGDKRITGTFTPSEDALTEWEDRWRAVWTRHLAQVDPGFRPTDRCAIPGCECGGKGHGVDFKQLRTERDAKDLGEYIAKTQDGKNPALELARGDLKGGRQGNMTPFELLGRVGDLMGGVPEEEAAGHGSLAWGLERWAEYETAVSGRRAIEWTRYLRPLLGLTGGDTEDDDMDVLFQMDAADGFRDGVQIWDKAWSGLVGRSLDLAVVEAVEGREISLDVLGDLVQSAGQSRAFLRVLSPPEVAELYDALLGTLARRRELAAERRKAEAAD
ncbi:replication protein [Streptomyces sp. NPDC093808]|uniref:replication protein n=1 Tax=Streptomyces sp. NPDC093808 TaxID=3154985 RepID=UPI00344F4411